MLPPRVLKMVVLVCRRWREVGEAPLLWSWVVFPIVDSELQWHQHGEQLAEMQKMLETRRLEKMLESRRLEAVREITMYDVSEELLQAVVHHKGLKVLRLEDSDLSSLTPGLLAKVVAGKEEVHLNASNTLREKQLEEVLRAVSEDSNVKLLDISGGHMNHDMTSQMTSIEPDLLASAFQQQEKIILNETELSAVQLKAVMKAIYRSQRVHLINFNFCRLDSVDPELLAKVVQKVTTVDISFTWLNNLQTKSIFEALNEDTKLKVLDMSDVNVSSVEPSLMGTVVNKLEEVNLHGSHLSIEQTAAILAQSCVQTNLKKLIMDSNSFEGSLDYDLVKQANMAIETLFIEGASEWRWR